MIGLERIYPMLNEKTSVDIDENFQKLSNITNQLNDDTNKHKNNLASLNNNVSNVQKIIEDRGKEIISSEVVQNWLKENEFKPKDAVATFNDLPKEAELKELRGVTDENAVYVFDGTKWVKQSNLNFDGLGEVKTVISDRVNVKSFGVVGDGITDDTVNLQKAIDYAIANKIKLVSGKLKCLTTDTIYVRGVLHLKGSLEIFCDHAKLGLRIAKDDNTGMIPNDDRTFVHNINVSVTRKTYTDNENAVGVYVCNSYFSHFNFQQIKNHKTGIIIDALNNEGTSYNKFNLNRFDDCYDGLVLKGSGGGWVTENTFNGGSFGSHKLNNLNSTLGTHIKILGSAKSHSNNNKFYNTSFEGFHPVGVFMDNTQLNNFYASRFEMSYATHFFKTTSSVQGASFEIQHGMYTFAFEKKFEDLGRYTRVMGSSGTIGYGFYYDTIFYEYINKSGESKIDGNTFKKYTLGKKSVKTIYTPTDSNLIIDLNEADVFYIKDPTIDLNITFTSSKMDIGEEKIITIIQGAGGVNITFPTISLGKKSSNPINRINGRDVYKVVKGNSLNEVYILSQYSN